MEFFGVLPLIMQAEIYMRRGYTLIAERYLIDTITTIAYFLDDPKFVTSATSRMLLRFIPKETEFIFLDADFETIYQRRAKFYKKPCAESNRGFFNYGALPSAALEPSHFINFQRKIYANLASSYNALVIDTSQSSPTETFSQIVRYLNIA
jgi:thymidylate kinase